MLLRGGAAPLRPAGALLVRGCAALIVVVVAALSGVGPAPYVWVVVLATAGAAAHRLLPDRVGLAGHAVRAQPLLLAAEAAATAAGVLATGERLSPLLPYLLVAPLLAGLLDAAVTAVVVTGTAALALAVGVAVAGNGRAVAVVLFSWVPAGLAAGLLATTRTRPRPAPPAATPAREESYAAAYRLLSQLRTVARQLSAGLDPVTLAEGLLATLRERTGYDRAAVLVRSGGERLVPLATAGAAPTAWPTELRDESPFEEAWMTQQPQLRATRFGGDHGERGSSLTLALRVGVRTLGVVGLEAHGGQSYGAEQVAAAQATADDAALRLDSALLFDEIRELATAEERRRLAREIHDGIAQELASVGYVVDGLAAEADGAGSDLAGPLRALRAEVTRIVKELRLSIFDLRSEVDRHGGLGAALSEYVRSVGTSSRFTVHLSLDEQPTRLPAEAEAELLRVAQEAITNARKHAGADNLWVTCLVDPPHALLRVEDDGVGLAGAGRADSFGLEVMRERAARLRGVLRVVPRQPRGTLVELTVGSRRGDVGRATASPPDTVPGRTVPGEIMTDVNDAVNDAVNGTVDDANAR